MEGADQASLPCHWGWITGRLSLTTCPHAFTETLRRQLLTAVRFSLLQNPMGLLLPQVDLGMHKAPMGPRLPALPPPMPRTGKCVSASLGSSSSSSSSSSAPNLQHTHSAPVPTLAALLVCPLTGQLLREPVTAADGCTYEHRALAAWLQEGNPHSPATGRPLPSKIVRPNFAAKALLSSLCA